MLVFLLACIVSFVPSVALFLWLRNRLKDEEAYKKLCNQTLLQGVKCMLPVLLLSGSGYLILRLTGLQNTNPLSLTGADQDGYNESPGKRRGCYCVNRKNEL